MPVICTWLCMIAMAAALLYGLEVAREEEIKEDERVLDRALPGRSRNKAQ